MSMNIDQNSKRQILKNSNEVYSKFINLIQKQYNIPDIIINELPQDFSFKLTYHEIEPQFIIDEIEAELFNNKELEHIPTSEIIYKALNKVIKNKENEKGNSNNKYLNKNKFRNKISSINSNINNNNFSINNDSNLNNIKLIFSEQTIFNEGENIDNKNYNPNEIQINIDEKDNVPLYNLIPINNNSNYENYEKYFKLFAENLLKSLDKNLDDVLINISIFIVVIIFDSTDEKPSLKELSCLNVLRNFEKLHLQFGNDEKNFDNYFFVSGQILYIEGNLIDDSKTINVVKYKYGFSPEIYEINKDLIQPYFEKNFPYLIYCLNGPFTSKEKFDLNVFFKLILILAEENPHLIILNGPFIHSENENIKNYEIDEDYIQIFMKILNFVKNAFKDKKTQIIITPSLNDVINYYPLPQPSYDKIYKEINNNFYNNLNNNKIKFISNPQIFQINEIIFSISNFDFIQNINNNCIRSSNKIPIDNACETILNQRNFYPVLNNTINEENENNLDKNIFFEFSQFKYLMYDIQPDILITNSGLISFAKKIYNTMFINPGNLFKGKNLGSFLRITTFPPTKTLDILKRVKIDIIKVKQEIINNTNNNIN